MEKSYTYILILSGIMLLFYYTGLVDSNFIATIITLLKNPSSVLSWDITKFVQSGILVAGLGTAVIAGFIYKNYELAAFAPMASYLLALLGDFLKIYDKLQSLNPVIATLLLSPIYFLYILIIFDYWRGRE